uniref:Uncharacterized protein n=1 Tax=Glossina austeni TaxID=7395 RepID=A0A1A9VA33_GLOAU
MCSPSGLILILIASLYYNCLLSVIVAADDANANKTNASKGPSAIAALADNNSYGGRFYIYHHNNKNDNNSRTSADDKMKNTSTTSSSIPGYDNILNREEQRGEFALRKREITENPCQEHTRHFFIKTVEVLENSSASLVLRHKQEAQNNNNNNFHSNDRNNKSIS